MMICLRQHIGVFERASTSIVGWWKRASAALRWRFAAAIATLVLVGALSTPAWTLEPKWPSGPYKYLVIDQDVKDVLTEFGRNIGIPVRVSDQVSGRVRGRLPITTAPEFLNLLCERNGLVWYFDGAILHIGAEAEVKTELVNIGQLSANELLAKLDTLGITDPRFPVRATQDSGIVSVSGPPVFVSLVQQTLAAMTKTVAQPPREGDKNPGIRVFRGGAT
jgi:type II secretory pathway component GspD/PulD (secretin)